MHLGVRLPPGSSRKQCRWPGVPMRQSYSWALHARPRPKAGTGLHGADGHQNELVEAVLAANPNTIVVLNNGAPLTLPWAEHATTLVEGWLAGEEGPEALGQILLGE